MKHYIIITSLLITLSSCGYGQYPKLHVDSFGRVVGRNGSFPPKLKNTSPFPNSYKMQKSIYYNLDSPIKQRIILYGVAGIQYDSAKFYYRKALELRKRGVPDSLNRYKKLLEKYKNK